MNKLIGTREAAEKLGVSLRRVQQLIELGTLPAQRIGRDYLIQLKDLSKVTIHGKRGRPKKQPRRNNNREQKKTA
jgi:excisionase family DNA binding protein